MSLVIREAVPGDAEGAGRVNAQVWREAYRGIVSDEWIANVSDEERIARWRVHLGSSSPARRWVALVDDEIVGFAASGPSRDAPPARDLELWSVYLLDAHSRRGIGTALTKTAIGAEPASVWVVEGNVRAQAFYRALGFVPDGSRERIDDWGVDEIRMVR
ncbi:MAG: acetyltransferase [Rhodoglobus sp.]|nr:acetyltransferase [Rhodoglobus sp.]